MKKVKFLVPIIFLIPLLMVSCSSDDFCISEQLKSQNANIPCPTIYKPVCGCDGITYGNDCEAKRAGVLKYRLGPCNNDDDTYNGCIDKEHRRKHQNDPCPTIYKPVCGCDGITYGNDCEANNAGVKKFTEGNCIDR